MKYTKREIIVVSAGCSLISVSPLILGTFFGFDSPFLLLLPLATIIWGVYMIKGITLIGK